MRYIVTAYFESQDRYTVEADSEEAAIGKAQGMAYPYDYKGDLVPCKPLSGDSTYERDAEVECVDWDVEPGEGEHEQWATDQ